MSQPETFTILKSELLPQFEALKKRPVDDAVDLLFVLAGISQAGSFHLGQKREIERDLVVMAASIANDLQKLGLVTVTFVKRARPTAFQNLFVVYSKDQAGAELLYRLKTQPQIDHRLYGQICGFPQTAIEGFVTDKKMPDYLLPTSITSHKLFPLQQFALSQDHYIEEWQWFVDSLNQIWREHPELIQFTALDKYFNHEVDIL